MAVQKFANDPEVRAKVARGVKEAWERAKPEIKDIKEQLKQDWEQAKPELVKTKEKARDLTKKLTK